MTSGPGLAKLVPRSRIPKRAELHGALHKINECSLCSTSLVDEATGQLPYSGRARYALLLHGYIATMHQSPNEAILFRKPSDARVVMMSTRSHIEHVILPNVDIGGVDVFAHSWNPSMATLLDKQYEPHLLASLHEPVETDVMGRPIPKARSQALSIGRAALLMQAHERRTEHAYHMALVMRHDLVVGAPVAMSQFAAPNLWFAVLCCKLPLDLLELVPMRPVARQQCGAPKTGGRDGGKAWQRQHSALMPCNVGNHWGMNGGGSVLDNHAYYLMDWWFAAPPAVVASWMDIALDFESHLNKLTTRLTTKGRKLDYNIFSHYLWPSHVHDFLNATALVRFADLQTALARTVVDLLLPAAKGRQKKPLRDCPYVSLDSLGKKVTVDQQTLLDQPFTDADLDRDGLFMRRYNRKTAPMAAMCPYSRLQQPLICCNQTCGEQRCTRATNSSLFRDTKKIVVAVYRGPRTWDNETHPNMTYHRVRMSTSTVAHRSCPRGLGRAPFHKFGRYWRPRAQPRCDFSVSQPNGARQVSEW